MMDAKLETLITLIDEKNFTNTAKKLFITQPAVTHHIKSIEKEYNITLFSNPKTFELTKQGQVLLEYAKASKLSYELLINTLAKQASLTASVGITPMAVQCARQRVISNLNKGNVSFNLFCYPYEQILKSLSSGDLDFAIVDNSFDSTKYENKFLFAERIILVCNPEGQYKGLNKITRDQLSSAIIVLPDDKCGLYNQVKTTMKLKNIKLKNGFTLTANNLDLTRALIDQNDAVAFVYETSVESLIENGKLKKLDITNFSPTQNFYLLYNRLLSFDDRFLQFLELLKNSGIQ
ncbi:MAG: LysR family transcriptional regulator [Acholeplasmatales bacterium]|nr:LysR family transcriptional regulator [Acholeplasmatales bacterium]